MENGITFYIWCGVGALLGWISSLMMKGEGRIALIENLLVGVFGAFIGGDFVVSLMNKGVVATGFSMGSLAFAVVGAVTMLLALKLMRGAVGPLRSGKRKARGRP